LRESKKTRFKSKGIDSDSDRDSPEEKRKNMLKVRKKMASPTKTHRKLYHIVVTIPDDYFLTLAPASSPILC
jgi:hypothetical protein